PRPRSRPRTGRRAGFSLLEVQVAFVLLGVGLAGVCPLVVMQARMARKIRQGIAQDPSLGGQIPVQPGVTLVAVPAGDDDPRAARWARKLGVSASFRADSSTTTFSYALPASVTPQTATVLEKPSLSNGDLDLVVKVRLQ